MMKNYAVADDSGNIMQIYSTSNRMIPCGERVNDVEYYVDENDNVEHKRPLEFDVATNELTATISGLPAGLKVDSNNNDIITDDMPLVITYDLPGTYEIRLSGHIQYLNQTLEVTVGDP